MSAGSLGVEEEHTNVVKIDGTAKERLELFRWDVGSSVGGSVF